MMAGLAVARTAQMVWLLIGGLDLMLANCRIQPTVQIYERNQTLQSTYVGFS